MEDQAELIRQQMQEKRAELSEKIQTLGESLSDLLPSTSAVTETVETVRETTAAVADNVQDTVKTVQGALDLPKHVQEHPWLAVGGAVVVGYIAHSYLTSRETVVGKAVQGLLSQQFQGLEQFASRAAFDLLAGVAAGAAANNSGSLLQMLLQQLLQGSSNPTPQGGRASNGTHPGETASRQPAASSAL